MPPVPDALSAPEKPAAQAPAPKAATPRKPWIVIVAVTAVVVLAAVWSGMWFYASHRAQREIDAWMAREVLKGRKWSCADRGLAGFPFRFELTCRGATLETEGGDAMQFTAASAHAVAQIWEPNHIVAEFAPPAVMRDRVTGQTYTATWSLLQMSGVGDLTGNPERFSLVVHNLVAEPPQQVPPGAPAQPAAGQQAPAPLASAKLFEFHARRAPAASGDRDGVDYAVGLTGGESTLLAAFGADGPVDLTLQGTVTKAADLRPMAVEERLKEWARAGGVATLSRFVISTPKAAANATGEISLDPQGRLNGRLDLGLSGLGELTESLGRAGTIPPDLAPIIGALGMAGKRGAVEGRPGVTFALGFRDGVLRLGPLPVGVVPPVF